MGNRALFAQLRRSDVIFKGKTSPGILYRHGRWHLITIGYVVGPEMEVETGISAINFMSDYRARKRINSDLPYGEPVPFEEVSAIFRQEVDGKVLPTAEDYRPLLRDGWMTLAGGYTTDSLQSVVYQPEQEDRLVAAIAAMICEGEAGPFLHFARKFVSLSYGEVDSRK